MKQENHCGFSVFIHMDPSHPDDFFSIFVWKKSTRLYHDFTSELITHAELKQTCVFVSHSFSDTHLCEEKQML